MTEILSTANERVKAASLIMADGAARREQRLAVAEGASLVSEAVKKGLAVRSLFATEKALEVYAEKLRDALAKSGEVFVVSDAVANKLSSQRTPQGVCAVFELPKVFEPSELAGGDRILMLCSVRDPQNVGAAIRSAAAFGFSDVLLSEDCADVFSPKSLRGSMGAAFSVRLAFCRDAAKCISDYNERGYLTLAAALKDDAVSLDELDVSGKRLLLAVGNEGKGLGWDELSACSGSVTIPMSGEVESLNAAVAAGVLMWQLRVK